MIGVSSVGRLKAGAAPAAPKGLVQRDGRNHLLLLHFNKLLLCLEQIAPGGKYFQVIGSIQIEEFGRDIDRLGEAVDLLSLQPIALAEFLCEAHAVTYLDESAQHGSLVVEHRLLLTG